MKKLLLSATLSLLTLTSFAQQSELRKGFAGISLGPAFLLKTDYPMNFLESTGIQVNMDFGYRFTEHVGLGIKAFNTSFSFKGNSSASNGLIGFMFGPLFTTASKKVKLEYDLKPMIGFANGSVDNGKKSGTTKEGTFAFGIGAGIRWNGWDRVSISGGLEYLNGKIDQESDKTKYDFSSMAITVGVAYRFNKLFLPVAGRRRVSSKLPAVPHLFKANPSGSGATAPLVYWYLSRCGHLFSVEILWEMASSRYPYRILPSPKWGNSIIRTLWI